MLHMFFTTCVNVSQYKQAMKAFNLTEDKVDQIKWVFPYLHLQAFNILLDLCLDKMLQISVILF